MITVINAVVLLIFSLEIGHTSNQDPGSFSLTTVFSFENLKEHYELIFITSAITLSIIGISSLGKVISLREGGQKIARNLGGTLVTADVRDPLRRRLYNVVEEISIASGVPVPDVFILENESGINAFAAGYGVSDAAVAVTQGTLEKLNRSELQGVIAHEFSHILNGDMRINIRLMGLMFGILVLAIVGRKFLHANRYQRRSSKNNSAGAVIAIGITLSVVGYVGLFFSRWLKSAISRQREYLADASAVQFTRDPDGIAGALKKIAAYQSSTYLRADTEEISHMLFTGNFRANMFATHPPLSDRIKRLERTFDVNEIDRISEKLREQENQNHVQAELAELELSQKLTAKQKDQALKIEDVIAFIGQPDAGRLTAARLMTESITDVLKHAMHSSEWAPEVLLYSVLNANPTLREKQLAIVSNSMGRLSKKKIVHLLESNGLVKIELRLPLLESAYPSVKRRSLEEIENLLVIVDQLVSVDRNIDSFEYLLTRLLRQYLVESMEHSKHSWKGRKSLSNCVEELTLVISTLASHGQNSTSTQGIQLAQRAFKSGMSAVGIEHKNLSFIDNWQTELDKALKTLNRLKMSDKEKVLIALGKTVLDDKKLISEEQEMMRVISALLHVPIPLLQTAS
ncbi:M48 family metallopeptidase [Arenicella sp. 4NH20-0111]|uniref:M48 family metallopeptidase n=1 Tax=Arenicella sp. 4NH20-0111 TaxID=3127648 RepID=UPI00310ADE21